MTAQVQAPAATHPVVAAAENAWRASPLLFGLGVLFLFLCLVTAALGLGDPRTIHGAGVWEKPAKFFLSLAVHLVSVAWAMSLAGGPLRGATTASRIMAGAASLEMVYIVWRAAQGEASHFSTGTPLTAALYTLMGLGALSITGATGFIGWRLRRAPGAGLMKQAAAGGLMLGALLGTLAGVYMSQTTGHWVGGDLTDATGLPVLGWSTTGGDLRVAHFVGLHAVQFLPLAALAGSHRLVWAVAALVTLATAATFLQAVMGMPLISG